MTVFFTHPGCNIERMLYAVVCNYEKTKGKFVRQNEGKNRLVRTDFVGSRMLGDNKST